MYDRKILEALATMNLLKTIEIALEEYKAGLITPDKYFEIKNTATKTAIDICDDAGKTGCIMPEEEKKTNTG